MRPHRLGGECLGKGRCRFRVWAPWVQEVDVHLLGDGERVVPLARMARGYFEGTLDGVWPGSLYLYRLDGAMECPDPASRSQPQGVHGPSELVDPTFPWEDGLWQGLPLRDHVIYELHVGTFTPEGTFDAVIPRLEGLRDLGITALEVMPVAQFPGDQNWGYDGVYPFAVQNSYGGALGLKRMVDACHGKGLAVILDVVYNHLGPEGNYLGQFGHYFTERYRTPWGAALNFDGPHSDEVRRFFIENALHWVVDYHLDGLRLDALHAIVDTSPRPFLAELAGAVREHAERLNRRVHLMAESDRNDVRFLTPGELGGYGLDAHWNDDFHHALHALLTGEGTGYYQDYGDISLLAKAFREGFIFSGQYSEYRKRRHGSPSTGIAPHRLVAFAQNHDQVGNRMMGDRLSRTLTFEALKLAAGLVLLSPFTPLLFMGEEYGETASFLYFVNHSDPDLIEAVRQGRREEFASFGWGTEPPDPQARSTFEGSKLQWGLIQEEPHATLLRFHRELIALRKEILSDLALQEDSHPQLWCADQERVLMVVYSGAAGDALVVYHLGEDPVDVTLPVAPGNWRKRLDSAEVLWRGLGGEIPDVLTAEGQVPMALGPWVLSVFVKERV